MTDERNVFVGKWLHARSECVEEFLAANGANWMVRKMISKSNPTVEITMNDDQVKVRILTMMVAREETFTVGTPYEQKQPDGHVSLASSRWEDGKLVIDYKPKVAGQGKAQTVTREIKNGQLVQTFEVDDVVMKRWFDKAT